MLKPAAGPLFFGVIAMLLFAGSYAVWPPDLLSATFEWTLGTFIRTIVSLILAVVGLEFLAALAILMLSDN